MLKVHAGTDAPGFGAIAPQDEHNRVLVANVHPADWKNPKPADRYHLVVLGAGTAGLVTAAGAAGLGAKVALVERHLLGGDCLNVGCVPSKAMIRSSRVVAEVRAAHRLGVHTSGVSADFPAVMERMRRIRAGISHHDSVERFRTLGVDVSGRSALFEPGSCSAGRLYPSVQQSCDCHRGKAGGPPHCRAGSCRLSNERNRLLAN
jgi:hypothetical protein